MNKKNIELLKNFNLENIPDLDIAVLGALELFQEIPLPKIDFHKYERPLVVGSGNAEATGRIIFREIDAVFASESNYEEKLKTIKNIDGIVLISASGEKHAPIIAKIAKQYHKKITLITNTPNSSASQALDKENGDAEFIFPKNREPYTYNTSTYLGMILAQTKESPNEIENFINEKIATVDFSSFANYDKFYLIIPPHFSGIIRMLQLKFTELFGRNVSYSIETSEYIKHATTVAPAKELFISFDFDNQMWGDPNDRIYIPLPKNAQYGAMMAIGYYVVAQIQKSHPQYFKENIDSFIKKISEIFNHELKAIVE